MNVADHKDMARAQKLQERKAKLLDDHRALHEMVKALAEMGYQGGFTKRQRMKNYRRTRALFMKLSSIHSLILTLKDTPTPK